jgi:hypothetical protein
MALQPFQGWSAHRVGGLGQSSTSLDTTRSTHMVEKIDVKTKLSFSFSKVKFDRNSKILDATLFHIFPLKF